MFRALACLVLSATLSGSLFAQTSNTLPNKPEPQKRTADKAFVLWTVAAGTSTVLDLTTTRHAIGSCGLHELNPFYGRNPSNARLALIGGGLTAAQIGVSYLLKKKYPRSRLWMLPVISVTGTHAVGAVNNLAKCH